MFLKTIAIILMGGARLHRRDLAAGADLRAEQGLGHAELVE